ncbi:MAG: endonuclease/exonuclease/phosphatase family protein [Clostridia bacterium]|nr:endonuclease/exonuclease/phosphatase family protein [Clostridia bacterium]
MKRFLMFLMAIVLLLSFAACSNASQEDEALNEVIDIGSGEEKEPEQEKQPEETPREEEKPSETPKEEEKPTETPEETPQETPKEEEPKEEEPTPQEPQEEAIDYSKWIKVASYNIKCLMFGTQLDAVAAELKEIDADIVGFQEVDFNTNRSGPGNQIQMIAEAAGYPYWAFTKLMDFQGGQYGMGIISRYPIKESTDTAYVILAEGDHPRKFGRHVLDVNGRELVFYNTHMTLGTDAVNGAELKQVTNKMANDDYAVLVGDMNMKPDNMGQYVNTKKVTVLNGGDDFTFSTPTFPAGKKPTSAIDNIVVTDTMDYYWNDNTGVGIEVSYTDNSDHNLIWTYVNFK